MKRTIIPFYRDREAILAAVLRDAVYLRTPTSLVEYRVTTKQLPAHPETLTTTKPGTDQEYHLVEEMATLVQQVEYQTGKRMLRSWGNINKSGHWLGPHAHMTRDKRVTVVACYYVQVGEGEVLNFKDGTNIQLRENMLLIFGGDLVHSFEPRERVKDKIAITFEMI